VASTGFEAVLLGHIILLPVIATRLKRSLSAGVTQEMLGTRQIVLSGVEEPETSPDLGVLSTRIWRVSDLKSKLDLILDGFGGGMMPEHLVEQLLADQSLSRLSIRVQAAPPQVASYLIHRADYSLGPAAVLFRERLLP